MNPAITKNMMQMMMNLMRDPLLQIVLNKDDTVQSNNVNFEADNKEVDQGLSERSKV